MECDMKIAGVNEREIGDLYGGENQWWPTSCSRDKPVHSRQKINFTKIMNLKTK